ncbi:MAG: TIGR00341 family protein [Verrucomicrobia bacterium]|nr:TIGR00341 family protein [Verrucomicrobiota bacterium]MCH8514215.1 TIGR00341 family protein [Kiritimatiellia bacterium]
MKYVEIIADAGSGKTLLALAEKVHAVDVRFGPTGEDGMRTTRLLVGADHLQETLDTLQNVLGAQPTAKVLVLTVESAWPQADEKSLEKERAAPASREKLYEGVRKDADCNRNYLILVALSTVVATIGLIEDSVAVVIGAMVIAPLLAPNLALSLGISLGDPKLMRKATFALFAGVLLSGILATAMGAWWPIDAYGDEIMARTDAGLSAATLALASGAAAALSMTTGLSSVLVGVMVAVALLPPVAALGIMIGRGEPELAMGAGLLLAVNIVCVNLAGNLVFFLKNIRPRSRDEKDRAKWATLICLSGWIFALLLLLGAILFRRRLLGE